MRIRPPSRFDRELPLRMSNADIASQIQAFNQARKGEFGAPPLPDKRLPIPYTGVGGDIPPEPVE